MKYFSFSVEKYAKLFSLALLATLCQIDSSQAQCALACHGTTQVSLNSNCDATITPSMILSDGGLSCPDGKLYVLVSDDKGVIPGNDVVSTSYVGQTLEAMVIDSTTGNSCWGNIIIEDKLGPTSMCQMGIQIADCADMGIFKGPIFIDNCQDTLEPILLSEEFSDCLPNNMINVTRSYTAVDSKGNFAETCTMTFRLRPFLPQRVRYPDSLVVKNNNPLQCDATAIMDFNGNCRIDEGDVVPDSTGVPEYRFRVGPGQFKVVPLFPFPDIFCNTTTTYEDIILPKIGCTQKIHRIWSTSEWRCDIDTVYKYTQVIEIVDDTPPEIMTDAGGNCIVNGSSSIVVSTNTLISQPGGIYGDFNCGASIKLSLPTATDNCTLTDVNSTCPNNVGKLSYDFTYDGGFISDYNGEAIVLPMGTSVGIFTVYDECYNSSQCHIPIEIIDDTPPITICDQNTTVSVTSGGKAVIAAESFDDGSYDDCKLHCKLVRRMPDPNQDFCECRIPEICDLTYVGNFVDEFGNNSNYYLSDYDISSSIAKSRATAYGGNLAILKSAMELQWVVKNVRPKFYGDLWIGMKREGSGFLWDDHSSVSYNEWTGGIVPSMGGDCVFLNGDNEWVASECSGSKQAPNDRRYLLEIPAGCGFSSGVQYCCNDVGRPDQMVVFRVVDFYGNFNDCMVNVFVQDKSAPALNCPPHRKVPCDFIFDVNNLDASFGQLTFGESCNPNIDTTITHNTSKCGDGTITRLFTALDAQDRELAHCKQIITFENDDPFDGSKIKCPKQDTIISGCGDPSDFGPDVMGVPEFIRSSCDVIGTDFSDQLFNFNNASGNEVCFKILRNWEIIDWCQYNSSGSFMTWTCNQVIKVVDPFKPQARFELNPDLEFTDKGTPIIPVYDCDGGPVTLNFSAEDTCTPDQHLNYSWNVYSQNGTLIGSDSGNGANGSISGSKFPVGVNVAELTYFDGCGNACTVDQEFVVVNKKAATAYCINGLAVDIMPVSTTGGQVPDFGMIELWASDFDAGSSHPCGYPVILSFSPDITQTNRTFTCIKTDINGNPILDANGNQQSGIGSQEVEIYVTTLTPDGGMVQTFCSTFIDIQDNHVVSPCVQNITVTVEGTIATEKQHVIQDIDVQLEGSPFNVDTDGNGNYAFPSMAPGGNYVINPYSDENPLMGISTIDLLIIQRHILGIAELDSPYKQIAADVNKDNVIDGVDLVELRKLILGIYTELPENDSWRFIDESFQFSVAQSPLVQNFVEDYEIVGLNQNMGVNFIAVKVGDVDGTVDANLLNGGAVQSNSSRAELEIGIAEFGNRADTQTIPVTLTNSRAIGGFQFELDFNSMALEVIEVKGSNIELNETNYRITDNSIVISWNGDEELDLIELEIIVQGNMVAQAQGNLFSLSKNVLNAEIYDTDLLTQGLEIGNTKGMNTTMLLENNPNPFNSETEIRFFLGQKSAVDFLITDIQGRVVKSFDSEYEAGQNTYVVRKSDLTNSGIYYVTMKTTGYTKTIKIVLID